MSATLQRDQACALAKTSPKLALAKALTIPDPWFRAQALSWVARFTDDDPRPIARQAAKVATECDDDYKRSAAKAWEIAALAERDFKQEARKCLQEAIQVARTVQPSSSRSEALLMLYQSAFAISSAEADKVGDILISTCSAEEHWRCARAVRDVGKIRNGELAPRSFFW
ncbi:MAG: hypothetical protein KF712_01280 [Akkermansiaceae bacterium]|nr:hypothetical protein [Akkermansiaceae bacterium]